jgi:ligand-binding SRPBCC domain-containing protein
LRKRTLETSLWLPRPIDAVFAFFTDVANLDAITPPWVGFEILTPRPVELRTGAIIDYRLRLHGIPVGWRTEITHWDPPRGFVDEQRRGPYRLWVHRHEFEEEAGGTRVRDRVEYAVPGGPLEPLVHRLFVAPDLRALFAHRHRRLRELLAPDADVGPAEITLA